MEHLIGSDESRRGFYSTLTVIVMYVVSVTSATRYTLTSYPDRPELNGTTDVTVQFSVANHVVPLGDVILIGHHDNDQTILMRSSGGQCLPGRDVKVRVTVIQCDFSRNEFKIRLDKVVGIDSVQVEAPFQSPGFSSKWKIGFRRPQQLMIRVDNDQLQCYFTGGFNHEAYFSWYVVNSTNAPHTHAQILPEQRWHRFTFEHLGASSTLQGATPGDQGWYECAALYRPSYIGPFITDPFRFQMKTAAPVPIRYEEHVVQARNGDHVKLWWIVRAVPEPDTILWYRNGEAVQNGSDYIILKHTASNGYKVSLEFTANEQNFGNYRCSVRNSQGQANVHFEVVNTINRNQSWLGTVLVIVVLMTIIIAIIFVVVASARSRMRRGNGRYIMNPHELAIRQSEIKLVNDYAQPSGTDDVQIGIRPNQGQSSAPSSEDNAAYEEIMIPENGGGFANPSFEMTTEQRPRDMPESDI